MEQQRRGLSRKGKINTSSNLPRRPVAREDIFSFDTDWRWLRAKEVWVGRGFGLRRGGVLCWYALTWERKTVYAHYLIKEINGK